MRALVALCVLFWVVASTAAGATAQRLDRIERPPATWRGPIFVPHFAFPKSVKARRAPWERVSFRKEPQRYLRLLLDYALEGQDRADWQLQKNTVRRWYHVPWLGPGPNGREFIHGLTRGHDLKPHALGMRQSACRQTWAVAFYNEAGGATLGDVWRRVASGRGGPDLKPLPFPVGTVSVKLVFTEATAVDDPRLAGAPELLANVHVDASPDDDTCAAASDTSGAPAPRKPQTLRLIQVDIGVREARASYKTGWVYGSFLFDGRKAGRDPWAKLEPIGLMWGNDPQLTDADAAAGAKPRQSIVFDNHAFGRGGRMNGAVDERSSACSSCHMAAQWPSASPMTAPAEWEEARCWFRNIDARYPFGFAPRSAEGCASTLALEKTKALDFSLQLAIALRNWSLENSKDGKAVRTSVGRIRREGQTLTVDGVTSVPLRR